MNPTLMVPPLPDLLPSDADAGSVADGVILPPPRLHTVRCGSWLINYRPAGAPLVSYDGTLRVECHSAGRTASGDLYQRRVIMLPFPRPPRPILLPGPQPAGGIPVLPRDRYRYYLRVTQLPEFFYLGQGFTLTFEMWRFTVPNGWALESTLTATMVRTPAPGGYPSAADYAEGDVKDANGKIVGRLTMGWLSKYLRRCTVEIDTVAGSERPTTSGAGHDWQSVMDAAGWQVKVELGDTDVAEPSGNSWSDAEMHAAMLARRAATNLDAEWRYHILAVKNIDSTPRGIMYDAGGTDSNNVPREGVGIASHWIIDQNWGTVGGQRFGTAPAPYFRTAVHEIGHAMGMYHNANDLGFMCTSDTIAGQGTATLPFPSNIQWSYHPDNARQLRHYPDPFVRPGGVAFGGASTSTPPITPTDLDIEVDGLVLQVTALLGEVPLGAPVRIGVTVVNTGEQPIRVPANIGLKGEFASGTVVDPAGTVRTFRTVVRCVDEQPFVELEQGDVIADGMTLMRGAEGALFPGSGLHQIAVELCWEVEDMVVRVAGGASVLVTAPVSDEHAAAAHRILATPDAHLVLAIGGDHLTDGIAAIESALDDPTLRPHFAAVEAKRLARRFGPRPPEFEAATALIDDATVMSGAEVGKLAAVLTRQDWPLPEELVETLRSKADGPMSEEAQAAVDAL